MRLTCFECRAEITITVDAPACPECGVDLLQNLTPLDWVRGHYAEAAQLAMDGRTEAALAVVEQGLAGSSAPELHLLAALLHRKLDQWDGVRRHVAAIPVDDALRPEGEWLIRAHQQQQRQLRQAHRPSAPERPVRVGRAALQRSPEYYPTPTVIEPPLPRVQPIRVGRWVSAALILVVLAAAFWQRDALRSGLVASLGVEDAPSLGASTAGRNEGVASSGAAAPRVVPTFTPAPTVVPTDTPLPTVTPVVPVAGAISTPEPTASPPPLAAAGDAGAAAAVLTSVVEEPFDLAAFLESAGRPDLANLPVSAQWRDGRLILDGVVPFTADRLDLLDLLHNAEGEENVDGVNLRVRLPDTYVVQEGDTLWTIAYRLYGDPTRWQELVDANPTLLADPAALAPGMALRVPPL